MEYLRGHVGNHQSSGFQKYLLGHPTPAGMMFGAGNVPLHILSGYQLKNWPALRVRRAHD